MAKIKNISSQGDLDVPVLNRVIAFGEVVDVPDDIAANMLEQLDVWASGDDSKAGAKSSNSTPASDPVADSSTTDPATAEK
jgi:hypothetical protein